MLSIIWLVLSPVFPQSFHIPYNSESLSLLYLLIILCSHFENISNPHAVSTSYGVWGRGSSLGKNEQPQV